MPHEVITFQFGNYSNYIGSHFWNIQESNFVYDNASAINGIPDINNDILFREGLNLHNQVTYTPRLIFVDLRDSLNSLKQSGNLYENKEHESTTPSWSGKVEVHKSEHIENIEYINENLDEKINYWSDYLKTNLHPRSPLLINRFKNENIEKEPFDLYHYGLNVINDENFLENFENILRLYSEECDYIQGFHFLIDSFNGFGGLTQNVLSLIGDEYTKKPVFSVFGYPYFKNQTHESQMIKLINTAFTMRTFLNEITESIIVPVSLLNTFLTEKEQKPIDLEFIDYKADLNYHTSAILASLIDCTSVPWRQKSQNTSLKDVYDALDLYKYKICALKSKLPFNIIDEKKYLFNYLQENDLVEKLNFFTPLCHQSDHNVKENQSFLSQILTCKGIEDARVKNPRDTFYFKGNANAREILDVYCNETYSNSINKCYSLQTPLKLSSPFPDIFKITNEVFSLTDFNNKKQKQQEKNVSLITSLEITPKISTLLETIYKNLEQCNIRLYNRYFDSGMEIDDYKELINFHTELYYLYSSK